MSITTISSRSFNQDTSGAKKAASNGPVVITDRGRPAHVLMTYAEYQKLIPTQKKTIAELLAMPEAADIDIEFPRLKDLPRDIDWS